MWYLDDEYLEEQEGDLSEQQNDRYQKEYLWKIDFNQKFGQQLLNQEFGNLQKTEARKQRCLYEVQNIQEQQKRRNLVIRIIDQLTQQGPPIVLEYVTNIQEYRVKEVKLGESRLVDGGYQIDNFKYAQGTFTVQQLKNYLPDTTYRLLYINEIPDKKLRDAFPHIVCIDYQIGYHGLYNLSDKYTISFEEFILSSVELLHQYI